MAERYWITGAQIGMLQGHLKGSETRLDWLNINKCEDVLEEVLDSQFIGRIEDNKYDEYEIVIKKKLLETPHYKKHLNSKYAKKLRAEIRESSEENKSFKFKSIRGKSYLIVDADYLKREGLLIIDLREEDFKNV